MTHFIREVKSITVGAEKIHGHKIKVMLRLPRDIEHCLYYGFDPVTFANEKLVDVVVASPRFWGSDSGIDVDEWRRNLPGVEIIPGIEAAAAIVDGKFVDTSKEIALGLCANYLSYNPEGIYFYNQVIQHNFFGRFSKFSELEKERIAMADGDDPSGRDFAVLLCGADYKTIHNSAVRFVIIPEGYEGCAGYPTMWRPIPTNVGAEFKTFDVRTGDIPKGKRCSVILGFDGGVDSFDVSVNGVSVENFKKINIGFIEGIGYQPEMVVSKTTVCYRATFDESILISPVQKVNVKSSSENAILNWVEINVY
jgi:hypothetical protein